MKSSSNISNLEIATYFIIWIGAVSFAGFKVKGISDGKMRTNRSY